MTDAVTAGLRAVNLLPVGHGYGQLTAGYAQGDGLFARAEAGWHPLDALSLYGYGEDSQRLGVMAGAGVRLVW